MKVLIAVAVLALCAGCSNREVKVSCDGKLVAINHPAPVTAVKEAP